MILVNNPGTWSAIYPPLRHAAWHGLTPTDLIFPFFLVIVGLAIPPSLGGRSPSQAVARVARRAAVIFALGLVLSAVPDLSLVTLRIPGVLQRVAVCYLVAAVLFLTTSWRTQAAVAGALLLGYWAALTLVPVPATAGPTWARRPTSAPGSIARSWGRRTSGACRASTIPKGF